MRAAALALFLAPGLTASASSHCYSVWNFPTPQHCGAKVMRDRSKDHSWYVEIVPPVPPVRDERTPEQIRDQEEHDAAVAGHKDELNELLRQAREEAAMKAAIGGLK